MVVLKSATVRENKKVAGKCKGTLKSPGCTRKEARRELGVGENWWSVGVRRGFQVRPAPV